MYKSPWIWRWITIFALCLSNLRAAEVPSIKTANAFGVDAPLSTYLNGKSIFVLGFYQCHHLCDNIVRNLGSNLKGLHQKIPVTFLSVDENEGPRDGLRMLKRSRQSRETWNFLVSDEKSIRSVTDAMGFEWKRDPVSGFITHESGVYLMNGQTIVKKVNPADLKTVDLDVESPQGKFFDYKQFCSAFDPHRSKYGGLIMKSLTALCVAFLIGIGLMAGLKRGQV